MPKSATSHNSALQTCGFRNTMSGTPCANPVAPGTVRCAAGHRVEHIRLSQADLELPGDIASSPTLDPELFGVSVLDDAGCLYNDIKAQHPEIQLGIAVLEGGEVVLDYIRIPKAERERGTGSKVLETVCARADTREWVVVCRPITAFGAEMSRLEGFLGRFGFRPMTDTERVGKDRNTWIRYPSGPFR